MNSLETNDQNWYNRTREIDFTTHFLPFQNLALPTMQLYYFFHILPQTCKYTLYVKLVELPFKASSIH